MWISNTLWWKDCVPLKYMHPKLTEWFWIAAVVQKLLQLEYCRKEEQQWAKLCYFPILEVDSSFMCPILIDRSQKEKKETAAKTLKYNWTHIELTFSLESWHDKHDRNFQRGWYFISIEVQILFHLIQKIQMVKKDSFVLEDLWFIQEPILTLKLLHW